MENHVGEIRAFSAMRLPRGWMLCEGQVLSSARYPALFSIIGHTYGGTDDSHFNLPDLRGRVPIGTGTSDYGVEFKLGQASGAATVTLTESQIPQHRHYILSNSGPGEQFSPDGASPAAGHLTGNPPNQTPQNTVYGDDISATMAAALIEKTGGGSAHDNLQPGIVANFMICVEGHLPSFQ